MSELIRFLAGLPAERERAYELNITDYVARNNTPQMRVLLEGILTGAADNVTDQIAYNAFYCLNVMYRRAKDYIELKELFDTYTKRFSLRHITFDHLKALLRLKAILCTITPTCFGSPIKIHSYSTTTPVLCICLQTYS